MKKIIQLLMLVSLIFILPIQSQAATMKTVVANNLGLNNSSVAIRDAKTGELVYSYNGNIAMPPASNLKLVTGAAALERLGQNYRFKTKLYIDGKIKKHVLHGNVYIEGSGDPTLNNLDFQELASALKKMGINSVTGHLIGDDTAFSGSTLSPGVEKQEESYYYAARTSAITMSPNSDYDASTVIVTATPSKVGAKPTYSITPNLSGMVITNQAKTVKKGQKNTIVIKRNYNSNTIVISGNLPVGSSSKEWVTVQDPTMNTLQAIKNCMQNMGIKFSTSSKVLRQSLKDDAQLIFTNESKTLAQMFPVFLKLSNNSMGDIFVKTLGKHVYGEGNLETGAQVLMDYGHAKDISMSNWRFVDGSGLSAQNRVTAIGLTQLLYEVQSEPYYHTFYQALPVAGDKDRLIGGTLKSRFNAANLQGRIVAKTGYIANVNTLTGYMKGNSGKQYIFSILIQNQAHGISHIDNTVAGLMKQL
ncbi:D-alanyl-D-alanine carboxypeptidase/D-alanyl-D-alanine-endopeptidase [Lysinibacillus sp. 2017]|uniref:D-alanyl-D-alanine carboxypeptidase/D-alanyl-D-alanine endopeptidase n=1 Tax=unclassified Lysinibacillus TaxID=2636778 RepID=UPI000D525939|nr:MULTISPECIES: D-alanyl-D-alanine carboxypeptidase/D-alanyl-D-alanine-endopeptidase [unclassified Lysinibacillus]AWE06830.1 D-alanyl-D-alanine carboxypeptidase/D-alanyl-D-alanine-endopeptidase [Lysinibacillus sp. 2017]TGN37239.1 D-alanyl-D-alanine carboxypeptidase/D-alanyl-D-alanine-endopeptidase [Lysinibacillus sp. S2017]